MSEQNNGAKTAEQLAAERLENYKKNADSFIDLEDVVVCVKRAPKGLMVFIQGNRQELQLSWAELNQKIMQTISGIDMKAGMAKKPIIQKPGSFLGGLRGMKR